MKKVLLSIMMCFLLVGCGNTLTCKLEEEEGTAVTKLKFKGDEVAKVTMEMKFENKDEVEMACELYKGMTEEEEDVKVKCSGSKITVTTTDTDAYDGMTKEEIKENLEDEGFKCK